MSNTIKYPFGVLTVETVAVSTTANTYKPTIKESCILYVKGSALTADSTVELTAATGLAVGTIVVLRWLSDTTARALTVKPLIHANGMSVSLGTISKATSVTLMYGGDTTWIPMGVINPIDVA